MSDVAELFEEQLILDDDPIDFGDAGAAATRRWFLVLRVVSRDTVPEKIFMAAMNKAWDLGVHTQIRPLSDRSNRFLATFDQLSHYNRVKTGTWFFSDCMVSFGEFDGRGAPEDVAALSLAVWIQVLDLDLVYHSLTGLRLIGRALGNFQDEDVHGMNKKGVIRVKILQDVRQPIRFEREFIFRGDRQLCRLVYERLHGVCNTCGSFLHSSRGCAGPQARRSSFPPAIVYPGLNANPRPKASDSGSGSGVNVPPPPPPNPKAGIPPPGFEGPVLDGSVQGKEKVDDQAAKPGFAEDLAAWNRSAMLLGSASGAAGSSSPASPIVLFPNPSFESGLESLRQLGPVDPIDIDEDEPGRALGDTGSSHKRRKGEVPSTAEPTLAMLKVSKRSSPIKKNSRKVGSAAPKPMSHSAGAPLQCSVGRGIVIN